MNIKIQDSQSIAINITKIKKQSKKLFKLAKENNETITIHNITQAQELLAKVYGYPSWHALQQLENNLNNIHSNKSDTDDSKDSVLNNHNEVYFKKDGEIFYLEQDDSLISYFQITRLDENYNNIEKIIRKIDETLGFNMNMGIHDISIIGNNEKNKREYPSSYKLITTNNKLIDENPLLKKLFDMEVDQEEIYKAKNTTNLKIYIRIKTKKELLSMHKEIFMILMNINDNFINLEPLKSINIDDFYVFIRESETNKVSKFNGNMLNNNELNVELLKSLLWDKKDPNILSKRVNKWIYILNYIKKHNWEIFFNLNLGKKTSFDLNLEDNNSFNFEFRNMQNDELAKLFLMSLLKTDDFPSEKFSLINRRNNDIKPSNQNSMNLPSILNSNIFHYDYNNCMKGLKVICGYPGSGKSVLLNTIMLMNSLKKDIKEIPSTFILDIGSSNSRYLNIIQDVYKSKELNDSIFTVKIENNHFVNIFDTFLGCRDYSAHQKHVITEGLLSLILSETPASKDKELAKSLLSDLLDNDDFWKSTNTIYNSEENTKINDLLKSFKFNANNQTWWDIVDMLVMKGYIEEAKIAQKYAVPNITKILNFINEKSYFSYLTSKIKAAVEKYPQILGVTNIDIIKKKIVFFDFEKISDFKTINYFNYMSVALLNLSDIFFNNINIYDINNSVYKEYYKKQTENKSEKILLIDEFQRWNKVLSNKFKGIVKKSVANKMSVIVATQIVSDIYEYEDLINESWINAKIPQNNCELKSFNFFVNLEEKLNYSYWKFSQKKWDGLVQDVLKIDISNYLSIAFSNSHVDIQIRREMLKEYSYMEYLEKLNKYLKHNNAKSLYSLFNNLNQNEKDNAIQIMLENINNS